MDKDLLKLFDWSNEQGCGCVAFTLGNYNGRSTWDCRTAVTRHIYWNSSMGAVITFEEVLNSLPEDKQTQLLFHLDYFTRGAE